MSDDERAALVERVGKMLAPGERGRIAAEAILAAVEPAIRADELARVVAQATTDEAIESAGDAYLDTPASADFKGWLRAAIRAALAVPTP